MTAALSTFEPIDRPIACARRRGLRVVSGSGGAKMLNEGDVRRGDHWSSRIVAIAQREDRAAFAELFAFFAPRVKAYLQKGGSVDGQAEDLAQETMLTVWRKAKLYDPGSASAATWIFTIARNLRIDALRRDKRGGAIRADEVEAEFEIDDS